MAPTFRKILCPIDFSDNSMAVRGAGWPRCLAGDDLGSAARLMRENRTRRLPVIDRNGVLVGILSLDDLACEAARTLRGGVNDELRNLVLEVHLSINRGRLRPPA